MGRTHQSASATHSCSPQEQGTQLSCCNIPELFRTQQRDAMSVSHASSRRSRLPSRSLLRSQEGQCPSASGTHTAPAPSLIDLQEIAADIKNTLSAAISDLRTNIHSIAARVGEVERTARHDASLCHVQQVTESHAIHLRELQCHLEDINDRGCRHNLRVRGLPESIESNTITPTVLAVFNEFLERPRYTYRNGAHT